MADPYRRDDRIDRMCPVRPGHILVLPVDNTSLGAVVFLRNREPEKERACAGHFFRPILGVHTMNRTFKRPLSDRGGLYSAVFALSSVYLGLGKGRTLSSKQVPNRARGWSLYTAVHNPRF